MLISDNIAFSVVRIAQGYAIVNKWVDLIRDFDMRNLANRAINGKNSVFHRANNALVIAGNIKIRIRNGRICVNGKFLPAGRNVRAGFSVLMDGSRDRCMIYMYGMAAPRRCGAAAKQETTL